MIKYVKVYHAAGALVSKVGREGLSGCRMVVGRQRRRPYITEHLSSSGRQNGQHQNSAKN